MRRDSRSIRGDREVVSGPVDRGSVSNERPEILLKTDTKTDHAGARALGEILSKSKEMRRGVVNRGEQIEIDVENGHWRPLSNRRPCCSLGFSGLAGRRLESVTRNREGDAQRRRL
jgi:hypothetical protein